MTKMKPETLWALLMKSDYTGKHNRSDGDEKDFEWWGNPQVGTVSIRKDFLSDLRAAQPKTYEDSRQMILDKIITDLVQFKGKTYRHIRKKEREVLVDWAIKQGWQKERWLQSSENR